MLLRTPLEMAASGTYHHHHQNQHHQHLYHSSTSSSATANSSGGNSTSTTQPTTAGTSPSGAAGGGGSGGGAPLENFAGANVRPPLNLSSSSPTIGYHLHHRQAAHDPVVAAAAAYTTAGGVVHADEALAYPHPTKRRRTNSYHHHQHHDAGGDTSPYALLGHEPSRGSYVSAAAAYSQPGPGQSYFLMQSDMAPGGGGGGAGEHAHQHHQNHHQQPPPLYHHQQQQQHQQQQHQPQHHQGENLDPIGSGYQGYVQHEAPAVLGSSGPHGGEPAHQQAPQSSWNPLMFDHGLQLKVQSLPVLDNCATKILEALSLPSFQEVLETATQPESGRGQAFNTQVALFDQMKKYYTRDHLFLSAQVIGLDPSADEVVRKTNMATFAVAIFSGRDVPFPELHTNCLEIFAADGRPPSKAILNLFLEVKTHAYLAALHNGGATQQDLMDYFPADVASQLGRRRLERQPLSHVEQEFVSKVAVRRQQLLNEQYSPYQGRSLYQTWPWAELLRVLCECLRQDRHADAAAITPISTDFHPLFYPGHTLPSAHPSSAHTEPSQFGHYPDSSGTPSVAQRSLSQRSASQPGDQRLGRLPGGLGIGIPSKDDKAPMQFQYEKARRSTNSKTSTPTTRRVSVASQRKPWSQEEEKALMDGLDRVKGPHWSQILALYGNGGRISDVLRERTQVQLKDKARNLKLFFLKSGIEVPTYLQGVTGELKTRAPAQAAKREREERMKAEKEAQDRQLQQPGAQQPLQKSQPQPQQPLPPPMPLQTPPGQQQRSAQARPRQMSQHQLSPPQLQGQQ